MNIEELTILCKKLPSVTEDIKWGNDLCFCVGGKMFCVAPLTLPFTVSFKVKDDEFDELSTSVGIIPAPYAARNKWVQVTDVKVFKKKEWEHYVTQSYNLVKSKLPKKVQEKL